MNLCCHECVKLGELCDICTERRYDYEYPKITYYVNYGMEELIDD